MAENLGLGLGNSGLDLAQLLTASGPQSPNMFQRLGAVLQGQPDPQSAFDEKDFARKMTLYQLAQQKRQVDIQERQAALKDLESANTILKVSKDFLPFIPGPQRDQFAQTLSEKLKSAGHPMADQTIIRSYLEKPEEGIAAFDALTEGFKSGKPAEGIGNALKLTKDPELRKSLLSGLFEVVKTRMKGSSLADYKAMSVEHAARDPVTGQIDPAKLREAIKDIETTPQGFESRVYDEFVKEEQARTALSPGEPLTPAGRAYERMLGAIWSVAGARGAGRIAGEMGVRGTKQFRDTEREVSLARRSGSEAAEARVALSNMSQASAIVDEMDQLSAKMITATTAMESNIQAVRLLGERIASGGSLPAVYDARKKNLAESLARNIGGVKGTATEGDIKRMVDGAPGFRDTRASRQYKINSFRTIIGSAIENQRLLIEGRPIDLEKARAEFKKNVDDFLAGKFGGGTPPPPGAVPLR